VSGLLQISISHSWLGMTGLLIEVQQRLIQAMNAHQLAIFQLPFVNTENSKYFIGKKRSVTNVREFVSMPEEERRSMLRSLPDDDYEVMVKVANQFPVLYVEKAYFTVLGDAVITPGAIVTLIVKMNLIQSGAFLEGKLPATVTTKPAGIETQEELEIEKSKKWWNTQGQSTGVYAPLFPSERKGKVWIFMCDVRQNRLITMSKVDIADGEFEGKLQFQSPPQPGKWTFQVMIKTDSYVGLDQILDIPLVVEAREAIEEEDFEDDISEPDEESIGAMMKKARDGTLGADDDASSDSDSSDSDSDEDNEVEFDNNDSFIE
jgi:translocation protein SEC63